MNPIRVADTGLLKDNYCPPKSKLETYAGELKELFEKTLHTVNQALEMIFEQTDTRLKYFLQSVFEKDRHKI